MYNRKIVEQWYYIISIRDLCASYVYIGFPVVTGLLFGWLISLLEAKFTTVPIDQDEDDP